MGLQVIVKWLETPGDCTTSVAAAERQIQSPHWLA